MYAVFGSFFFFSFFFYLYQKTKQAINGLIGWKAGNSSWNTHTTHMYTHTHTYANIIQFTVECKVPVVQFSFHAMPKLCQSFRAPTYKCTSASTHSTIIINTFITANANITNGTARTQTQTIFTNIEMKLVFTWFSSRGWMCTHAHT